VVKVSKPIVIPATSTSRSTKPSFNPLHVQPCTEPAVMLVGKDFPDLLAHLAGIENVVQSSSKPGSKQMKRIKPVSAAFGSSTARFKNKSEKNKYNSFGGYVAECACTVVHHRKSKKFYSTHTNVTCR
jgi:hypothetical protein